MLKIGFPVVMLGNPYTEIYMGEWSNLQKKQLVMKAINIAKDRKQSLLYVCDKTGNIIHDQVKKTRIIPKFKKNASEDVDYVKKKEMDKFFRKYNSGYKPFHKNRNFRNNHTKTHVRKK